MPVAATCDVVIVGAGYTGLSAAITLARAGRSVQVFDRQRPGQGASTRSGGITSGNLRLSRAEMARRFGDARADAVERHRLVHAGRVRVAQPPGPPRGPADGAIRVGRTGD